MTNLDVRPAQQALSFNDVFYYEMVLAFLRRKYFTVTIFSGVRAEY